MGKSIQQIRNENEAFYMDTYASRITRENFWGMFGFWLAWTIELIFMKYSFDKVYYFKLARSENLANQEVKGWIEEQIWKNLFPLENFVLLAMIIAMGWVFVYFWKMKRYELHKHWEKMFYLPLLIALVGNTFVFLLLLRRGKQYVGRNILAILANIGPYLFATRMLFPLEIKKNEQSNWKWVDWLEKCINWAGKWIEKL